MSSYQELVHRNRLMDLMPDHSRSRLLAGCELVELGSGQVLCVQESTFTDLYFPLTACMSLMMQVPGRPPLGMALIGSEGMLGASVALGVQAVPMRGVVQGAGQALQISVPDFMALQAEEPAIRAVLDRYLYVLMEQLSQTAACNRFHEVEARLARWLLLTHDRVHADTFQLTHVVLAELLGVQRSAVTIAAGTLQKLGLIRYARGVITIINRAGLELRGCECCGSLQADYRSEIFTALAG